MDIALARFSIELLESLTICKEKSVHFSNTCHFDHFRYNATCTLWQNSTVTEKAESISQQEDKEGKQIGKGDQKIF